MLELSGINVKRGSTHVLHDISLQVNRGEIVTLIGSNGAGKTTTLQTISGLLRPSSGQLIYQFDDQRIELNRRSAEQIVGLGLVQCPEGRQIFTSMSVAENLEVGAYSRNDKAEIRSDMDWVYSLFPILKERRHIAGGSLSGGEQMMLAIGRALLARPRLLLLDEPSLGLAPKITEQIFDIIELLRKEGTTILLIEQNAAMALAIADRGYVLENGHIVMQGTGRALAEDDKVRNAYLGNLT